MQQPQNGSGQPGDPEQQPDEMERDLAEDAVWKRIQQNTFTRWANEHLKTVGKPITNLETDLSDGLRLIALVEVLSGRRLPKHNKKPTFRSQKLENVSVALQFLEEDEGIKIVNIDSSDIVDCKLKLILGLIWTLILHYSISLPMWEGEEGDSVFDKKGGPSPKQRLLGWIQSKLPDLPINNFNSDWNDGRAVAALVDALAPGLCPDWCDMKPENALQNAKEAMDLADNWLGVPQLVKPEEMVNPNVDDLSMMTYLSQYPKAELKPGAPLRPRTNPNRVRCYGPGIEPTGVNVGAPTMFTVETFSAGKGKVEVFIENPKGKLEPVEIKFNDDRSKTYTVKYTAQMEGAHKVKVMFSGKEVPKSPFSVMVEGHAGDPAKVTASGPGLEPVGVMAGKPTYFDIFTKDAGRGQVEVIILDPKGNRNTVPCRIRKTEENVYRCEYVAQTTGMHSVNVFFAGQQIPKSPFGVKVTPVCDARKVKAFGRGLQKNGVRVKDTADFRICTENAGNGQLEIKVIGPGGVQEKIDIRKVDENNYDCAYYPSKEGRYIVTISYGGQEISKSPYEVNVLPYKESKIRVYGPGLYGGVAGYPARFTAETNGETGVLGFLVEGPSHAKIQCFDNGDGSADVEYLPTTAGEYAVHILCDKEDIPKSPYMAQILPKTDYHPEKVEAYGPGLQPNGVVQGQPTEFTIDCRKAGGHAPLDVSVMDDDLKPVELKITDNKDGTFKAQYRPVKNSKHTIQVNYGGVAIPKSPFRINVGEPTDTNKVKVFGPGVENGVKAQVPTHFNIDCRGAGTGNVQVKLSDEKGGLVPVQILDNEDGTYSVDYVAPSAGNYMVSVQFAGKEIPNSPIKVKVEPQVDVSKVKVDGLEPSVYIDSPTNFIVDARAITKRSDGKVQCTITNPSGAKTDSFVQSQNDGTYKICYTPFEEGNHTIDITYDGLPVPGSPFKVNVMRGCDPRKVKAFGPGLEQAIVNQVNSFTVETKGAGRGALGLMIVGPVEPKMTCKDNRDGSCTVEYTPVEVGMHEIGVKYADQDVPGSPFKVMCTPGVDASKVKAYGPGVEPNQCRAGKPIPFTVDATKSGKAPLDVQVSSEKGPIPTKPEIRDNGNGTFDVSYVPPPEGSKCNVKVAYGGKDIPGSPFQMKVKPSVEPKNVKISGDGVLNKVPASIPVEFTIDTKEAGKAELNVDIKRPDGKPLKTQVVDNKDGTYKVRYVPEDVGPHKISVKYGGQDVPNTPITVNSFAVGQADKCKITEGIEDKVSIGEEYCITVNADEAGNGAVTCQITSSNMQGDVDIQVEDNGDGTFSIFYSVKETGNYTINVKFGGNPVPGGSFTMQAVTEKVQRKSVTKTRTTQSRTTEFRSVELHSIVLPPGTGQITAEVKMPSGKFDKPQVIDNQDGTISIKYDPREEGLHELHVKYNQEHIPGSPFKIFVDSITSGYVTAHGPGLSRGIAGEPANFTIYTKNAGAGGLDVAVQGPSQAEITCHDNKDGTVAVNYLPASPGEYKISVKFAGKHIKGSPFTAKITGEGRKRNQISVGHSSEVSLKVQEKDARNLNASIVAPSGLEEPCFLKTLPNGHLGISFTPREAGPHLVNVKRTGNHIQGSPFTINVLDQEIGDATKVKVIGDSIREGKTHVPNEFKIDTKEAGFGGLSLSVEGPSKADIQCKDNEDGTLTVSYKPTEPGYYIVNLKFADHHVPGSPFTVKVLGEGSNIQREFIKKQRDSVPVADVGNECKLQFRLPGASAFDMSARVTSPSGVSEDAAISDCDDCLFSVHFTPKEVGVHTVSVRCKDMHIPGSPFQFTVGPFRDHGAHRVHAGGPGLLRGMTNEVCEFNVWTREAGAGSLAISVEGPSKADIDFKDCKDGSCFVKYKVTEPGDYRVGIKFNEQHIPDSPYHVFIMPPAGDAAKIELAHVPETGLQANKPVSLAILMNGAKGNLDGKVLTPSGTEDDVFIAPLDADQWAMRFVPRENGIHLIHIRCDGIHIPQSPFRLRIGQDDADPAAVQAYGQGLKEAVSGTKTDFIVDTCSAGTGTLAVTIDGPSKVSMDCTEVEEGYKVRYTPLAPGDYFVTVKYNGYHISGSPFKVPCSGKTLTDVGSKEQSNVTVETSAKQAKQKADHLPRFRSDANKVTSKGMGLKKAHLNRNNQFTVNCGEAGNNLLFCSVYGPKGPSDEVHVKTIGKSLYQVNYTVKERGDHIVVVKWGDDHIPGSPFKVEVS